MYTVESDDSVTSSFFSVAPDEIDILRNDLAASTEELVLDLMENSDMECHQPKN